MKIPFKLLFVLKPELPYQDLLRDKKFFSHDQINQEIRKKLLMTKNMTLFLQDKTQTYCFRRSGKEIRN
jgi:hypothetical protein